MSLPTRTEYLRDLTPIASRREQPILDNDEENECPVCRLPYEAGQVVQTHCCHNFCYECLRSWTESHNSCPSCRTSLYDDLGDNFEYDFEPIPFTNPAYTRGRRPDVGSYPLALWELLFTDPLVAQDPNADCIILNGQTIHNYVHDYFQLTSELDARPMPDFLDELLSLDIRYTFARRPGTLGSRYEYLSARAFDLRLDHIDFPDHPLHLFAYRLTRFFSTPGNEHIATYVVDRARLNTEFPEIWASEYSARIDAGVIARMALPETDDSDLIEVENIADKPLDPEADGEHRADDDNDTTEGGVRLSDDSPYSISDVDSDSEDESSAFDQGDFPFRLEPIVLSGPTLYNLLRELIPLQTNPPLQPPRFIEQISLHDIRYKFTQFCSKMVYAYRGCSMPPEMAGPLPGPMRQMWADEVEDWFEENPSGEFLTNLLATAMRRGLQEDGKYEVVFV